MEMLHKATARAAGENPFVFVMSDATVDRYGDVIDPKGWKLADFRRNPIALFGHSSTDPIGVWRNVRVENNALIGELEFLPAGRSPRVDELRAFVETGMLRAVSVGFRPVAAEPIPGSNSGGVRYTGADLVECSLVSIPANPNALAIAKQLHLSDDVRRLVFGKSADETNETVRRGAPGEPALKPTLSRTTNMTTLAQRIENAQSELNTARDGLSSAIDNGGDIDALAADVEKKEAGLLSLKRAEKAMGETTDPGQQTIVVQPTRVETRSVAEPRRPFAVAAKKVEPVDYIFRSMVVGLLSHKRGVNPIDALRMAYGEDVSTKAVMDVMMRSATVPADTVTPAWAGVLVETAIGDFFDLLMPTSVYPQLSAIGGRFGFGTAGQVSLPTRSATPTVAGSFVGQGAPIPVRQAGFSNVTITPKKMAVITTMTREITEHSTPQIEQILRAAIQEDTSISIDTVLLDTGAATTIRPAGLRNGASSQAGTAGGGITALVADVKGMLTDLATVTAGNLRAPVWIMSHVQAISAGLVQDASGAFPFKAELAQARFQGYPAIVSPTVPAGTLMLVDAADFMSATGDVPRFDVSDQAVLHMEDTAPQPIATAGSPNVVAAPIRSMFQTDSLALRMILDLSWAMRRAGVVIVRTAVTW